MKKFNEYQKLENITKLMQEKAKALKEGKILIVYKDGTCIRMETERGVDPYVWRKGNWRKMRDPNFDYSCELCGQDISICKC